MHLLFQQNVMAHYRTGLLRVLARTPDSRLSIVSSTRSDTPFLELAHLDISSVHFIDAPVRMLRLPFLGATLTWQPGAIQALELEPDVVIALGSPYSLTAWALVLICRLKRLPVLLWTHGILEPEKGAKWWVRAGLFRLATGLLLYGDRAQTLLLRQRLSPGSLHVMYNSLDVDEQLRQHERTLSLDVDELRTVWGVSDADRVLIFTGRLERRKSLDRLIETISHLRDKNRRVHLLLVGDGSLRSQLEEQSRKLKVHERVHFCGAVHSEDRLAEAYRVSDLCVIPSGPGLTVMHAMVYGVPVLTTEDTADQYPEAEAIIPGVTGFLCDTQNARSLASDLEHILFPESPRRHMEEACRKMIMDRYTPAEQARRIEQAARLVLAARDT